MSHPSYAAPTRAYFAWLSVALFFAYQYILRVLPGVLVDELRGNFGLTAQQFGALGAYYLYPYSLLQIPVGLFLDRLGVRRTILGSLILCLVSTLILAGATQFWMVLLSRVLLGAGSAAALMGALKIAADHLPAGQRGPLMGATLSMGTLGALTAGQLVTLSWSQVIGLALGLGVAVFILAYLSLPRQQAAAIAPQKILVFQDIRQVLRHRNVILYAIAAIGIYTPLAALADLWGTAFLREKFSLGRSQAAQSVMLMYVGLSLGSLILPWICERTKNLDAGIKAAGLGLFLAFGALLYGPVLTPAPLVMLLIFIGFLCGAEMMCFTGATRFATAQNSGITLGVVNTLNMLGGAVLQYMIGFLLDWNWRGGLDGAGLRLYATDEFVCALSSLLVTIVACWVMSLRLGHRR